MRSDTDRVPAVPHGPWLLRQHRLLIARHAPRLGRGPAEDLASEAVVRSLTHPAPDGNHGPWLERLFQNLLVDHLRRGGRMERHAAAAVAAAEPAVGDTPEQEAARRQLRRRLAAVWPELRPEWRQALEASFFAEDRASEAHRAGLRPATIRTRTFRALAVLRRALRVAGGWIPVKLGFEASHAAAAVLPAAFAATTVLSPGAPPPPERPLPALAQVGERRPAPAPAERTPAATPAKRTPATTTAGKQPHTQGPPAPSSPPAVQHFDYDDDDVSGNRQSPDGVDVQGSPAPARHGSLIEIPGSFAAQLLRSLEDL